MHDFIIISRVYTATDLIHNLGVVIFRKKTTEIQICMVSNLIYAKRLECKAVQRLSARPERDDGGAWLQPTVAFASWLA